MSSKLQIVEEAEPACRKCGSTEVVRSVTTLDMKRKLLSRRYICKKCGTTFTAGKARYVKTPAYVIHLCIALVKKGMMIRDVAPLVSEATGIHIDRSTVGFWLRRTPGYKPHFGRQLGPKKSYYKPTQKKANLATIRSIRADLKRIQEKLGTMERRQVEERARV